MKKTSTCCDHARRRREPRQRGFTLLEFVTAAVLFVLLLGCMDASVRLLRDMRRQSLQQNRALAVLDNTVERLAALKQWDADVVARTVREEFARSELAVLPGAAPQVQAADGCVEVRVQASHRVLAKVSLNTRRKE